MSLPDAGVTLGKLATTSIFLSRLSSDILQNKFEEVNGLTSIRIFIKLISYMFSPNLSSPDARVILVKLASTSTFLDTLSLDVLHLKL